MKVAGTSKDPVSQFIKLYLKLSSILHLQIILFPTNRSATYFRGMKKFWYFPLDKEKFIAGYTHQV